MKNILSVLALVALNLSAIAAVRPYITDITVTDWQVRLSVSGEAGATYVVERTTDFRRWTPVVTNLQIQAWTVWVVPVTSVPTGFFRLAIPPAFLPAEEQPHVAVNLAPESPEHRLVMGGQLEVLAGVWNFTPTEEVLLRTLPLRLTAGLPRDIGAVTIWSGETFLGETAFVRTNAVVIFDPPLIMNGGEVSQLTIRVDTACIGGRGCSGVNGDFVAIDVAPGGTATGMFSGQAVPLILGAGRTAGFRIVKAVPTFRGEPLPSRGLPGDGGLLRFSVTAPPEGDVSLGHLSFGLRTEGCTIPRVKVSVYTDQACTRPIVGTGKVGWGDCDDLGKVRVSWADSRGQVPLVIPAGQTLTFEVKWASFTPRRGQIMSHMWLLEDATPSVFGTPSQTGGNTVWAPGDITPYEPGWLTGYGVPWISEVSQVRAGF